MSLPLRNGQQWTLAARGFASAGLHGWIPQLAGALTAARHLIVRLVGSRRLCIDVCRSHTRRGDTSPGSNERRGGDVPGRMLVTGGAGFVGSHLCEYLHARGADVLCLDDFSGGSPGNLASLERRPSFTVVGWDLERPEREYGPLVTVFHCGRRRGPTQRDADLRGTRNALEIARRARAVFVLVSSDEPGENEAAESVARSFGLEHGLPIRIARVAELYGPRQGATPERTVALLIARAVAGEPIEVPGDGSSLLRPCHVDDVVAGLVSLACASGQDTALLASERTVTWLELATKVLEATGSNAPIVLGSSLCKSSRPSDNEGMRLAGWEPATNLEDGLALTIAWVRE